MLTEKPGKYPGNAGYGPVGKRTVYLPGDITEAKTQPEKGIKQNGTGDFTVCGSKYNV